MIILICNLLFSLNHSSCKSFQIESGAQGEGLGWEHGRESLIEVMGLNKKSVCNV